MNSSRPSTAPTPSRALRSPGSVSSDIGADPPSVLSLLGDPGVDGSFPVLDPTAAPLAASTSSSNTTARLDVAASSRWNASSSRPAPVSRSW